MQGSSLFIIGCQETSSKPVLADSCLKAEIVDHNGMKEKLKLEKCAVTVSNLAEIGIFRNLLSRTVCHYQTRDWMILWVNLFAPFSALLVYIVFYFFIHFVFFTPQPQIA